jgi:hypothetical protein
MDYYKKVLCIKGTSVNNQILSNHVLKSGEIYEVESECKQTNSIKLIFPNRWVSKDRFYLNSNSLLLIKNLFDESI